MSGRVMTGTSWGAIGSWKAAIVAALVVAAGSALGAAHEFDLSGAQVERLGVVLGRAVAVDGVNVATAPAEVVVPPAHHVVVSTPVAGVVARLLVAEGEPVRAGDPVAEVESAEVLDWQRAYLDAAVEHDLAAAQQQRDASLHAEGIIAARRVEESRARMSAARARLQQARQQLQLAGYGAAELGRLSETQELSARLMLRASLDGVVLSRHAAVGTRVGTLEPVLEIADIDTLWLELHVSQEDAQRVRPGMRAEVDAAGGTLTGTITTIGSLVEAATQMVLVRAAVDNTGGALKAGQFLPARVVAASDGNVFALPAAAVTRTGGDAVVFARTERGFRAQPVELLAEDGVRAYVGAGVDAGTPVAVEGVSTLKSIWLAGMEAGAEG